MLRIRVPAWLYMTIDSAPSHRNQTGMGSGAPRGVTVVSQTTVSSRSWRATRAPNSVSRSITGRSYEGHAQNLDATPTSVRATVSVSAMLTHSSIECAPAPLDP